MMRAGARAPAQAQAKWRCGFRSASAVALVWLSVVAPTPARADGSEREHHGRAATLDLAQLDPQTAAVARRLWDDLVCLCERCNRLTLSSCHCPDAAKERDQVVALLRGRDLSAQGGGEAAYRAVLDDFVQRKGRDVLASTRKKGLPFDWLALAISVGIVALACAAVVILEYRRRSRRRLRSRVRR